MFNDTRRLMDENERLRTELAAEKEAREKAQRDVRARALDELAALDQAADLSAKLEKAKEALKDAEAVMTIVEPRNNKAEYLECLNVVRAAIRSAAKEV